MDEFFTIMGNVGILLVLCSGVLAYLETGGMLVMYLFVGGALLCAPKVILEVIKYTLYL